MAQARITKVGVVGIGLMGSGIAQVAATTGFHTIVIDVNKEVVERGLQRITDSLTRLVESYEKSEGKRGISAEQKANALQHLHGEVGIGHLRDRDIIIEAIIENFEAKAKLNEEISALGYDKLLVSNTSSISITRLAHHYHLPEQYMGMHFMNPVPLQPGCELIRGFLTSEETAERVTLFAQELGKVPIKAEDKAGFGINRMFVPFLNEAVRVVEEGIMSVEDADKTTLCLGHKMGPLTTLDYVGLDTALAVAEVLEQEFGPFYKPAPLLRRLVDSGHFGVKNGKGFYLYEKGKPPVVNPAVARYRIK